MQWYVWMLLAAILGAGHNIIRKKALKNEHTTEYLTIFTILSFILLLPFFSFVNFDQSGIAWMLMYVAGLLLTFSYVFLSKAYRHLNISDVAPLTNFNVLFVLLISIVFLKETVTWFQLVGIALILIGSYVLQVKKGSNNIWKPFSMLKDKYVKNILIALAVAAVAHMLSKMLLTPAQTNLNIPPIDPFTFVFITRMFMAINFTVILVVFFDGFKGIKHGVKNVGLWILFAAALSATGAIMYYAAMSLTFLVLATSLSKIETLLTTVVGGEIFHDKNLLQKTLACLIIIAGSILVIL